jgi:iron complex outermembrane receptor protein
MVNVLHAQSTPSADAGATLEEIVVTAERREVDVQKLATSVAVRSGEELAEQGKFSLRQILEDVAGASAVDASATVQGGNDVLGNAVTIRGITPNAAGGIGPNTTSAPPTTAVYVDGIYEGVGGQYDIERVELSRGPQGTLYGRSATSGVLAVHTVNPSFDEIKGNVSAELGNYKLRHYSAALNLPATDNLAFRISADHRHQGEGYYNDEGGERKKTAARVKMLYEPTDTLSILVGAAMEDNDTHTGGISRRAVLGSLTEVETDEVPVYSGENKHRQLWTEINWNMGAATLTYQGAVRTWEQYDYQFVGAFSLPPPVGFVGYIQQQIETPSDQFITHEVRLASNAESGIKWQTGVSYYNNKLENMNRNEVNTGTPPHTLIARILTNKETEQYGVFGEATFPFTDSTRLTAGVRFDRTVVSPDLVNTTNLNFPFPTTAPPNDIVTLPISSDEAEQKFSNFTFKLRLEQDLTPSNMVYASVSSGFVPGDVNIVKITDTSGTYLTAQPVDAEALVAYELGSKNRFLDDSLQLNVGAFFYDYGGFQTSYLVNPSDPSSTLFLSVPAQNYGAEVEALWQVTSRDRIALNYSYVRSKFVDRTDPEHTRQFPDDERGVVPQMANASYQHLFSFVGDSELSVRIAGRWTAAYNTDLSIDTLPVMRIYTKNNARLTGDFDATWRSSGGKYSVGGYVRNFTDKRYYTYRVGSSEANVDYTDPRTYGVILSARF